MMYSRYYIVTNTAGASSPGACIFSSVNMIFNVSHQMNDGCIPKEMCDKLAMGPCLVDCLALFQGCLQEGPGMITAGGAILFKES